MSGNSTEQFQKSQTLENLSSANIMDEMPLT